MTAICRLIVLLYDNASCQQPLTVALISWQTRLYILSGLYGW